MTTTGDVLAPFARVRRYALLVTLGLVVAFVLWFRATFEIVTIPKGMDTLPSTHPPGAYCLVVRHPKTLAQDDVVFVDVPEGGTLLARVVEVGADGGVVVAADNERSTLTGGKPVGPLAAKAARGRVAIVF